MKLEKKNIPGPSQNNLKNSCVPVESLKVLKFLQNATIPHLLQVKNAHPITADIYGHHWLLRIISCRYTVFIW